MFTFTRRLKRRFPILYTKIKVKFWLFEIFIIFLLVARLGALSEFVIAFRNNSKLEITLETTIIFGLTEILPSVLLMLSFLGFGGRTDESLDSVDSNYSPTMRSLNQSVRESDIFDRGTTNYLLESEYNDINRTKDNSVANVRDIINDLKEPKLKKNKTSTEENKKSKLMFHLLPMLEFHTSYHAFLILIGFIAVNLPEASQKRNDTVFDERGNRHDSLYEDYDENRKSYAYSNKKSDGKFLVVSTIILGVTSDDKEYLGDRENNLKQALKQMISDMGVDRPSMASLSALHEESDSLNDDRSFREVD